MLIRNLTLWKIFIWNQAPLYLEPWIFDTSSATCLFGTLHPEKHLFGTEHLCIWNAGFATPLKRNAYLEPYTLENIYLEPSTFVFGTLDLRHLLSEMPIWNLTPRLGF